jgi:hypothetical protein
MHHHHWLAPLLKLDYILQAGVMAAQRAAAKLDNDDIA